VATTRANGEVIEKIQYTPYGSALTHLLTFTARADFNSDGGVDGADIDAFTAAWANSEPSADVDQSGGVDGGDVELFYTLWANSANQEYYETQPGACQTTSIRFGYAGYVRDASVNDGGDVSTFGERNYTGAMARIYHVRHRAYDPELGRWTRRDPIGYVDGMALYEYVEGQVMRGVDPFGLSCFHCCGPAPCCNDCGQAEASQLFCQTYKDVIDSKCFRNFTGVALTVCLEASNAAFQVCVAFDRGPVDAGIVAGCAGAAEVLGVPPFVSCGSYPRCMAHFGANFRCMCNCMGASPSENFVRWCIFCSVRLGGASPYTAHAGCWAYAVARHGMPTPVVQNRLATCIAGCVLVQFATCGFTIERYPTPGTIIDLISGS